MIAAPTCSHRRPYRPTAPGPDTTPAATPRTKTTAGLLVEAELLAACVPGDHRAAADRLLEDLRFVLATDGDREIGPAGLLAGLTALAELRKLTKRY